jgi:beta-glucosidase-like glycosyl hydrolase/CubicO group peptidase (beta-lactamase class C family)
MLFLTAVPAALSNDPSWVEQTLRRMSLEEKLGQMVFPTFTATFMNEDSPEWRELVRLVQDRRVGGFHIYGGDVYAAINLTNRLQRLAKVPLLFDADFERGVGARFDGATEFPSNMAVGATGSTAFARALGRIVAQEARALGIHITFAPVLDVNSNPENPIINTRAYGEDPDLVARLGEAFIRGCRDGGLLTTAKHFPGHGDTGIDSHLDLPVIDRPLETLAEVELPPFRHAIAAGVDLVMTAHIALPEVAEDAFLPSTLSVNVLTRLLRGRLGFQGVIVTDALGMGAIRKNFTERFAAVRAVQAGADILLAPPSVDQAIADLRQKVLDGTVSESRIDQSVRRILYLKQRLGLHRERAVSSSWAFRTVGKSSFRKLALKVAQKSITLVKNSGPVLPLDKAQDARVAVVTISDSPRPAGSAFLREIRRRIPGARVIQTTLADSGRSAAAVLRDVNDADLILLGLFVRVRARTERLAMPEPVVSAVDALAQRGKRVVAVSFGSPYLLRQMPDVPAYLCAYGAAEVSQVAAARAILGEAEISGHLPVTITADFPAGYGLKLKPRRARKWTESKQEKANVLRRALPEEAGFDPERLNHVNEVMHSALTDSAFPGAVLLVARDGKIVLEEAYGLMWYGKDAPVMRTDAIFDLASVTKVVATTTAAMILYDRGQLDLDAPVKSYLPRFTGDGRDQVTVRNLLTHTAGLPPFKRFFLQYQSPEKIWEAIYATALEYEPGAQSVYSDIGMMLMAKVVEQISGKPLDTFCREEVFEPLGMRDTYFNPPSTVIRRIPPTEYDRWRGRLIRGEVHDENAYAVGGVSGHAGLFSTARDVAILLQTLLNGGAYGETRLFKPETVSLFVKRANLVEGSSRALGWDTPSPPSSSGRYFSPRSFGHTGFTGTSVWVDRDRQLFVILLTNRVHPTRENNKIREVRPAVHDAVMQALRK